MFYSLAHTTTEPYKKEYHSPTGFLSFYHSHVMYFQRPSHNLRLFYSITQLLEFNLKE